MNTTVTVNVNRSMYQSLFFKVIISLVVAISLFSLFEIFFSGDKFSARDIRYPINIVCGILYLFDLCYLRKTNKKIASNITMYAVLILLVLNAIIT